MPSKTQCAMLPVRWDDLFMDLDDLVMKKYINEICYLFRNKFVINVFCVESPRSTDNMKGVSGIFWLWEGNINEICSLERKIFVLQNVK